MSLDITHGAVRRGRRTVLEAGRITAPPDASVAIVGINGSGKSSLFMHLADALLSSRRSSSVTRSGRPATLAFVPQIAALPVWLRVEDAARLYGLDFDALAGTMPGLYLHELSRARAASLSVGQRQALSIALALGRSADVTLLDEPFSALDFRRRIGTIEILRQHKCGGRAILLSSQSASDLTCLCDWFVVIREGRYVFNGPRAWLGGVGHAALESRLLQLLT